MKYDRRTPCASCPYRREVEQAFWSKEEFDNLRRQNANTFGGAVFGCHETNKKPPEEHQICIGWLLDQKKNNVPSIPLRMTLMTKEDALNCFKEISDEGLDLYASVEEMCEANYPGGRNRPRRSRKGRRRS